VERAWEEPREFGSLAAKALAPLAQRSETMTTISKALKRFYLGCPGLVYHWRRGKALSLKPLKISITIPPMTTCATTPFAGVGAVGGGVDPTPAYNSCNAFAKAASLAYS